MKGNLKSTILSIVFFLSLFLVKPVSAQEPTPANDENCISCHENQYYLYDSGKNYCLCEAPMHCIYCHAGRTDSLKKEIAHEGLVLYPTHEQASRCKECHKEDYLDRVKKFSIVAGIKSTQIPIVTATPIAIANLQESIPPQSLIDLSHLSSLQWLGVVILSVLLLVVIVFGYRCWKQDCLLKSKNP